jgi:hypothetical protein
MNCMGFWFDCSDGLPVAPSKKNRNAMAVGLIMDSAAIVESKEESLLMPTYGWLSGVHHRCGIGAARVNYLYPRMLPVAQLRTFCLIAHRRSES